MRHVLDDPKAVAWERREARTISYRHGMAMGTMSPLALMPTYATTARGRCGIPLDGHSEWSRVDAINSKGPLEALGDWWLTTQRIGGQQDEGSAVTGGGNRQHKRTRLNATELNRQRGDALIIRRSGVRNPRGPIHTGQRLTASRASARGAVLRALG